jgi:DNA polymerase II
MATETKTCFLLNYTYRDNRGRFEVTLFAVDKERLPVRITIDNFRPLFFIPHTTPATETGAAAERKELPLKAMAGLVPVDCLYFSTYAQFLDTGKRLRQKGIAVFESDVNPVERYLMERFVAGGFEATGIWTKENDGVAARNPTVRGASMQPALGVLSFDIETNAKTGEILSIACCGEHDRVFIRGIQKASEPTVLFVPTERDLLNAFFDHVHQEAPDVIIGWNVIDFDLWTLQNRSEALRIPFRLGRDRGGKIIEGKRDGQRIARLNGRVVIDVPTLLRTYYSAFEEYSLDFVASAMLGRTKSIRETGHAKIEEIIRQFNDDPLSLARYNLLDAQLTKEIFDKAGILPNAVERSKRSGHLLDRVGGNVAAFDFLYLPLLHRAGYVASDAVDAPLPAAPLPGGFVIEPVPGIYENVLVFDFRSLYPSIIMTFKIDPLGLVAPSDRRIRGPAGPAFADDINLLPGIIAQLMEARAQAKRENNPYLSQAIKILMNSFYGIFGAVGCRFFSGDISTAITRTGQYILKQTIEHIHSSTSYRVIYGDTDSLFVLLGKGTEHEALEIGGNIARETTAWFAETLKERFGATSALLLQFERHFRRFFMPALRGSTIGSKKHYCGLTEEPKGETSLLFKGMESARTDWTDLAKEFQHELILRVFANRSAEEYVAATAAAVRAGNHDDKLVYKKRLRKRLDEYVDHVPPHVQAARLLPDPGHLIRYYITTAGPQPVERRTAPIDYEHYIEAQLKPVADTILEWQGTSFDKIVSGQQELF